MSDASSVPEVSSVQELIDRITVTPLPALAELLTYDTTATRDRPPPRPVNRHILFRKWVTKTITGGKINYYVEAWRIVEATRPDVFAHFMALQHEAKKLHKRTFPDYKYRPKRAIKNEGQQEEAPPRKGKGSRPQARKATGKNGSESPASSNQVASPQFSDASAGTSSQEGSGSPSSVLAEVPGNSIPLQPDAQIWGSFGQNPNATFLDLLNAFTTYPYMSSETSDSGMEAQTAQGPSTMQTTGVNTHAASYYPEGQANYYSAPYYESDLPRNRYVGNMANYNYEASTSLDTFQDQTDVISDPYLY